MIRYAVSKHQLEQLIETERPGWIVRAEAKTEVFRQKGFYEENSSIWSEVKAVYMRLQGMGKCAYCEREMESPEVGKVEQDVEHFRPKGSVKAWKSPKKLKDLNVPFTVAPKQDKGYHLLPYHLFNYSAACKPCNSTLKKDYFPIAGVYNLNADDPAALAGEKPYLIYPIGNLDVDPESLISFHGASPKPVAQSGHARNRALVTIAFFKLDEPEKRKNLYRDRAIVIMGLVPLLQKTTAGTAAQKAKATATIDGFLNPRLRHLNCAKSFKALFEANPAEAESIYNSAVNLMATIS